MVSLIECCVRNVDDGVRRRLREGDNTVRVRPCLEHCGVCRVRPFLVVDGELVTGHHLPDREGTVRSGSTCPRSPVCEDVEQNDTPSEDAK